MGPRQSRARRSPLQCWPCCCSAVPGAEGKKLSLDSLIGKEALVAFFYPKVSSAHMLLAVLSLPVIVLNSQAKFWTTSCRRQDVSKFLHTSCLAAHQEGCKTSVVACQKQTRLPCNSHSNTVLLAQDYRRVA